MKQPVRFHLTPQIPLLFWYDAVYAVPLNSTEIPLPANSASLIWSLFDFDDNQEPPWIATSPGWCFPVQAPSPADNRYKKWRKRRGPLFTTFPLWSHEELAIAVKLSPEYDAFREYMDKRWNNLSLLEDDSIGFSYRHAVSLLREIPADNAPSSTDDAFGLILSTVISRFGLTPRDVTLGMYDFYSHQQLHNNALSISLREQEDIAQEIIAKHEFPNTPSSHRVVSIDVIGEIGTPQSWTVNFKSVFIGNELSGRFVEKSENETRSFVQWLSSVPAGKGLAGSLFEPLVHRDITRGTTGNDPDSWSFWSMSLEESPFAYDDSATEISGFSKIPRKQIKFPTNALPSRLANDEYYVPSASNFPSIDSFIVNLDFASGSAHLWLLQTTTSEKHEVSKQGYVKIRKIIETIEELLEKHDSDQSSPRKRVKGLKGKPVSVQVHYVLVCLESEVKPGLKWELPKGWDEGVGRTDHRGDGYLLKFRLVPERVS